MIVFCEECGKKYRIDPAKIKGRAASFKCRSCSHRIVVPKPPPPESQPQTPPAPSIEQVTTTTIERLRRRR
jgi:predicted Zn finger-like uncharacterized protein